MLNLGNGGSNYKGKIASVSISLLRPIFDLWYALVLPGRERTYQRGAITLYAKPGSQAMDVLTRGRSILSLLLLATVLLSGCDVILLKSKLDYFINPNGSGKVRIETELWLCEKSKNPSADKYKPLILIPECKITPRTLIRKILKNTRGVEVWKDVEITAGKSKRTDGRAVQLNAIAYFRNIEKLRLNNLSPLDVKMLGNNQTRTLDLEFLSSVTDDNDYAALFNLNYWSMELANDILSKKTPEARRNKIAAIEAKFKNENTWNQNEYSQFRLEINISPPGRAVRVNNLRRVNPNRLQLVVDGAKVGSVGAAYIEERVPHKISAANSVDPAYRFLLEQFLGNDGPITAKLSRPFKVLFDYEREVAEARKALPAMMKRLEKDEE